MEAGRHAALLREVYREIIFTLGTVLSLRRRYIRDELVEDICRSIAELYRRHRVRYSGATTSASAPDQPIRPHPAVVRLLEELRNAS
jgi:hypothetical protein